MPFNDFEWGKWPWACQSGAHAASSWSNLAPFQNQKKNSRIESFTDLKRHHLVVLILFTFTNIYNQGANFLYIQRIK